MATSHAGKLTAHLVVLKQSLNNFCERRDFTAQPNFAFLALQLSKQRRTQLEIRLWRCFAFGSLGFCTGLHRPNSACQLTNKHKCFMIWCWQGAEQCLQQRLAGCTCALAMLGKS